jgi:hypothetical protein
MNLEVQQPVKDIKLRLYILRQIKYLHFPRKLQAMHTTKDYQNKLNISPIPIYCFNFHEIKKYFLGVSPQL